MLSFLNALPGAMSQGLIWGIMAIGVYITYKILDIADLTVDGSFCTGGAVFVMLFSGGANVWAAMLAALLAGMLAGLVTGLLNTQCGIPAILAGILTQLGLYSVNMAVMDFKASVAINVTQADTLEKLLVSLRFVQGAIRGDFPLWRHPILVVGLFTVGLIALLYGFFGTELGCALRATGSNGSMARAQGIDTDFCKVLGLMISNGLVALSGALLCQYNGANEINVGRGAIVIGLAAVIIGQVLFSKLFHNFALKLLAVAIGAILYYIVIQAVLAVGLNPNYLKLLSALVVAVFLSLPYWKGKYFHAKVKTGGASHA
ncbi:ABC transporter permease [uncultured Oscillibacter sp.]|jgi:putative ABC transport system permease protein|uniref:ABC transporter permease n=1 Tax=uncultured Oscillibacter sp. TaxID=876091 RepID=UPI00216E1945|nr:ABC transporter permease [uncultured Oscillibacter sp.]MCI9461461.1 ABC transporter permease [Oscillibacter sp.]